MELQAEIKRKTAKILELETALVEMETAWKTSQATSEKLQKEIEVLKFKNKGLSLRVNNHYKNPSIKTFFEEFSTIKRKTPEIEVLESELLDKIKTNENLHSRLDEIEGAYRDKTKCLESAHFHELKRLNDSITHLKSEKEDFLIQTNKLKELLEIARASQNSLILLLKSMFESLKEKGNAELVINYNIFEAPLQKQNTNIDSSLVHSYFKELFKATQEKMYKMCQNKQVHKNEDMNAIEELDNFKILSSKRETHSTVDIIVNQYIQYNTKCLEVIAKLCFNYTLPNDNQTDQNTKMIVIVKGLFDKKFNELFCLRRKVEKDDFLIDKSFYLKFLFGALNLYDYLCFGMILCKSIDHLHKSSKSEKNISKESNCHSTNVSSNEAATNSNLNSLNLRINNAQISLNPTGIKKYEYQISKLKSSLALSEKQCCRLYELSRHYYQTIKHLKQINR